MLTLRYNNGLKDLADKIRLILLIRCYIMLMENSYVEQAFQPV